MNKFQNKYRIPSARLQNWDYGANGAYFITICTAHRTNYFGEIVEPTVETRFIASLNPSELGKIAQQYWTEIPNHFPFIQLGEFVVMPNHVHGILIINKNTNVSATNAATNVETRLIASLRPPSQQSPSQRPPSQRPPSQQPPPQQTPPQQKIPTNKTGGVTGNKNPMFHENISRIIRWYKGRCSFEMRKIHADFAWQPRFYDHIIRNEQSFQKITDYISNNPAKWNGDKFYNE